MCKQYSESEELRERRNYSDREAEEYRAQRDELSMALRIAAERLDARGHRMGAREAREAIFKNTAMVVNE